jgi:hypothetical protein
VEKQLPVVRRQLEQPEQLVLPVRLPVLVLRLARAAVPWDAWAG